MKKKVNSSVTVEHFKILHMCVFILAKGLGGAMFWALDLDDFQGRICGEGKYPLINAVKTELDSYTDPPTSGTKPDLTKTPVSAAPPTAEPKPDSTKTPVSAAPPTAEPKPDSTKTPVAGECVAYVISLQQCLRKNVMLLENMKKVPK